MQLLIGKNDASFTEITQIQQVACKSICFLVFLKKKQLYVREHLHFFVGMCYSKIGFSLKHWICSEPYQIELEEHHS